MAKCAFRAVLLALITALPVLAAPATTDVDTQGRFASASDAGYRESGRPLLAAFDPREYDAHAQNWAVVQHPSGLVYIGNNSGVLEFDGRNWRRIEVDNRTVVRSLALDAGGRIYVGAVGEIGYLEPEGPEARLAYRSLLDQVPEAMRGFADVWRTFALADGVYFASFSHILRWDGERFDVWQPTQSFHLALEAEGRFFVREVGRGLLERTGKTLSLVAGGERFADERIYALLPWDRGDGSLLVGTRNQGFFVFDGSHWRPWLTEADAAIQRDLLSHADLLSDDRVVLGTLQGGVYLLARDGRLLSHWDRSGHLPDNMVLYTHVDRQQGLWLALGRGVARIETGSDISQFDEANGLAGGVNAVLRHAGRLFAATEEGLFVLEPGSSARFRPIAGIDSQTWNLLDLGAHLLVANNYGVYQVDGDHAQLLRPAADTSFALHASQIHPGRVYIGLGDGLAALQFADGEWRDLGQLADFDHEVRSILEQADGRLWLGTYASGALRVTLPEQGTLDGPHQVETFGTGHGLPNLDAIFVYALAGQPVFTSDRGLYRFDEATAQFRLDPQYAALFADGSRSLPLPIRPLTDAEDRVWMYLHDLARNQSEQGMALLQDDGSYRWDPRPLAALHRRQVAPLHLDPDGTLWLGGADGLVRVSTEPPKTYGQTFQTLIRKVTERELGTLYDGGDGQAVVEQQTELPPGPRLRFEYAALSFDSPHANLYRVWLEGLDEDWSTWSDEPYIDYANLWEGSYTFRVQAKNRYGTLGEPAAFGFRVEPPWYRTVWAYAAYLLLLFGCGRGLMQWRLGRLEQQRAALATEVRARTADILQLDETGKELTATLDLDQALERVYHAVQRRLDAHLFLIALYRADDGCIELPFLVAEGQRLPAQRMAMDDLAQPAVRCVRDQEAIVASEAVQLGRYLGTRPAPGFGSGMESTVYLPLRVGARTVGCLGVQSPRRNAYAAQQLEFLRALAGFIAIALDNARTARELDEARAAAEAATLAKSDFLASMSHEIRTPMNAILGFSGLGLKLDLPAKTRDYFEKIAGAGRHLLGLINDVLDFSKIEAGKLDLEVAPFSLHRLLGEVRDLFALRAEEKGVTLAVELSPDVPDAVLGDTLRLGQVLINLVGNALKFTEQGRVNLQVSVDTGAPAEPDLPESNALARGNAAAVPIRLRFAVSDTGIGMTPEQRARLFQPFTQAESGTARRFGGTGLGLTISQRLVQAMGGEIGVDSEAGRGSRFHFALTLQAANAEQVQALAARAAGTHDAGTEAILRGARVLLVDDNRINREVGCEILAGARIHVVAAESGVEALKLLREQAFDAVLMDIEMPELDGYQTTARIREMTEFAELPVIAMTAHALSGYRERCLEAGMNDYVTKPVEPETLFTTLAHWLAGRRMEAADGQAAAQPTVPSSSAGAESAAQGVSLPAELPGIDLTAALRRLGGNAKLLRRLIAEFERDFADYPAQIRTALAAADGKTAARLAHTLKSVVGNLSAHRAREAAEALEDRLRHSPNTDPGPLLAALEEPLQELLDSSRRCQQVEAAPAAAEPAASTAIDWPSARELAATLQQQLARSSADADRPLAQLRELLRGHPEGEALHPVAEALDNFDFASAHRALEEWRQNHADAARLNE